MPGPAFITGKYGGITIGGNPMCLDSWDLDESGEPVDVTTWCSPRGTDGGVIRAEYEPGLIEGSFTASGPYRGTAPAIGDVLPIVFQVNATTTAARQCLITSVKISHQLKGKATISLSGKVTGLVTTFVAPQGATLDKKTGWTIPTGSIPDPNLQTTQAGGPLVWGPGVVDPNAQSGANTNTGTATDFGKPADPTTGAPTGGTTTGGGTGTPTGTP